MKKKYESPEIEVVKFNLNAIMTDYIDKSDTETGAGGGNDGAGDDPFA